MKPYDVLIAGGGISGLYMALKCCEKGLTVYMMEKDSRWGGRMQIAADFNTAIRDFKAANPD